MFKKLLPFIFSLFLCFNAWAQDPPPIHYWDLYIGGSPSVAGCTTANDTTLSNDSINYGDADNNNIAINDTTKRKASWFTLAAQSTITQYIVRLYKLGATDDFTLYCSLYTNCTGAGAPDAGCAEANNPAAEIADTSATISSADLTEDVYVDEELTLATPKAALAAGTYWLVCKLSARTSGTASWAYDNNSVTGGRYASNDAGTGWTDTANQTQRFKVLGCAD